MQSNLTQEEKSANFETSQHIAKVREFLDIVVVELLRRGREHDASKMEHPEVEGFAKAPPLINISYTDEAYKESVKNLNAALAHHYANSRHHTEHYKNGINDMTLVDLIEMFCDWKAATLRQKDGNLRKSIETNANKYGISPQLVKILENSIELFDK